MGKRYRVTLTLGERDELEILLSCAKADKRRLAHARILLEADESKWGAGCTDSEISESCSTSVATVERLRKRFVEEGLEAALSPYKTPKRRYQSKLDGDQEAKLVSLAAVHRQREDLDGLFGCWLTRWSSLSMSKRYLTKPFGRRLKKRT